MRIGERGIDAQGLREMFPRLGWKVSAQQGGPEVVRGDGVVVGHRKRVPEEDRPFVPVSGLQEGVDPEHQKGN
jgi:hypothetical protein